MTDDLQAAASRLRAHDELCTPGTGGHRDCPYVRHGGHVGNDLKLLADAWLAELDETPVDEAWLRSVGFELSDLFANMLLRPIEKDAAIVELSLSLDNDGRWWADLKQGLPHGDNQKLPDDHVLITSASYSTRGAVRRLAAALGIELGE